MTIIEARKASLLFRVKQFGGPLNEPAILAQFLAQVMHESGGLRSRRPAPLQGRAGRQLFSRAGGLRRG